MLFDYVVRGLNRAKKTHAIGSILSYTFVKNKDSFSGPY